MAHLQLALFSITLFLSASLMFGLQPMVGRMLLPLVGGAPAGWIVAMAFFQVMLLLGYFLAHVLARVTPRKQAGLYALCLVIGALFLPVGLGRYIDTLGSSTDGIGVFLLLTVSVAVPFIALSATSSTLQRLFTVTGHPSAHDPYFLYAASNLGSFVGLLAYPFMVEPHWALSFQSHAWTAGYVGLFLMGLFCLLSTLKQNVPDDIAAATAPPAPPPLARKQMEWCAMAFLPSALLCAVTAHIMTDVGSMPLLWVLPLGLYLLTFVIAFGRTQWVSYDLTQTLQPIAVAVALGLTFFTQVSVDLSWYALGLHLLCFFVIALMCHMRLAHARPRDSEQKHLTRFYLMMSLGGAAGGVLVAFVAPVVFMGTIEYPLLLAISGLFNPRFRNAIRTSDVAVILLVCAAATACFVFRLHEQSTQGWHGVFWIIGFMLLTLHPKLSVIFSLLVGIAVGAITWMSSDTVMARGFYGVVKIYERTRTYPAITEPVRIRYMAHGTTMHGYQVIDPPEYETVPTSYYTQEGPLGDIINWSHPKSIAAVGLGTGTISCYARADLPVTFFEIDPIVIDMAKKHFTFLSRCGDGTIPDIILGDARIELERQAGKTYDLIVLDAFSSDSVPTHLLTREAMEIYLSRLNPGGVLLFHISNRFFVLEEPIAKVGETLGLENAVSGQSSGLLPFYGAASRWIALARKGDLPISQLQMTHWAPVPVPSNAALWTDDYSNLMSYLRLPETSLPFLKKD